MIKRQKLIGIIASVALAAIGTALLVVYVQGAEDRALEGEEPTTVLVVNEKITKGTSADTIASMVHEEKVPAKVVAQGALSALTPLKGQVAIVDLFPGEQLVKSRFAAAANATIADVPPGSLQVTVHLEMVRAMGGEVREGDTVAVVASFDSPTITHIILHKVPVTKVRNASGTQVQETPGKEVSVSGLFVTLAADAPSIEKIVFAVEHGRVWLAREPAEAPTDGTRVVDIEKVLV